MNGHRGSLTAMIGELKGNKLLCTHYSTNIHCRTVGFTTQIIHKLAGDCRLPDGTPDANMDKLRGRLELQYMSELRTCYPYGLNDRYKTYDLFSRISHLDDTTNTTTLCFTPLTKVHNLAVNKYKQHKPLSQRAMFANENLKLLCRKPKITHA